MVRPIKPPSQAQLRRHREQSAQDPERNRREQLVRDIKRLVRDQLYAYRIVVNTTSAITSYNLATMSSNTSQKQDPSSERTFDMYGRSIVMGEGQN